MPKNHKTPKIFHLFYDVKDPANTNTSKDFETKSHLFSRTLNLNAEITDCTTYTEYRGKGLLSNLIFSLENELKQEGFYTLYSLSRTVNVGIKMVLSKHGYNYTGRFINNCNISEGYEDMNIWVKEIK